MSSTTNKALVYNKSSQSLLQLLHVAHDISTGKKLGLGCCHALADGPASVWVAAELPAGHRHAAGLEAAACLRSPL